MVVDSSSNTKSRSSTERVFNYLSGSGDVKLKLWNASSREVTFVLSEQPFTLERKTTIEGAVEAMFSLIHVDASAKLGAKQTTDLKRKESRSQFVVVQPGHKRSAQISNMNTTYLVALTKEGDSWIQQQARNFKGRNIERFRFSEGDITAECGITLKSASDFLNVTTETTDVTRQGFSRYELLFYALALLVLNRLVTYIWDARSPIGS